MHHSGQSISVQSIWDLLKRSQQPVMVFGIAMSPGLTGWLIDRGFAFKGQMITIAVYIVLAAIVTFVGLKSFGRNV